MPMLEFVGGDDDVAATEQARRCPAKQRPELIATSGTRPLRWPNKLNAMQSSPARPVPSVSPGRPPPPSVNTTTGSRRRSASSNSRSFFRWFCRPCVPASTV